jgi:hypothetical protein
MVNKKIFFAELKIIKSCRLNIAFSENAVRFADADGCEFFKSRKKVLLNLHSGIPCCRIVFFESGKNNLICAASVFDEILKFLINRIFVTDNKIYKNILASVAKIKYILFIGRT